MMAPVVPSSTKPPIETQGVKLAPLQIHRRRASADFDMDSLNRPRRMWTKEEDDTLRRIAEAQAISCNGTVKDWCSISKMLPGRTNKDCRKRYSKVTKSVNKGTWSPDEDRRLVEAMATCGPSWQLIAEKVATRHAEQCAKRWQHSLDPNIDRSEWTEEENQILMDAVNSMGRSWRNICRTHFPQRSTTDIKNHFEYVIRHTRTSMEKAPSTLDQMSPNPDLRDMSSETSGETSSMPQPSPISHVSNHPSVHNRTEPILTGCHPGPDAFMDFDMHSPHSRPPMTFSPTDGAMMHQPQSMEQCGTSQSPFDLALRAYNTPLDHPHMTSNTTMASQSPSMMQTSTSPHYPMMPANGMLMSGPPQHHVQAGTAHVPQYFDYSRSPQEDQIALSPYPQYHQTQSPQLTRSPGGSRYTLVLDELQEENVNMVLEPLARSGVNVSMKLYEQSH